MGLFGKLFGEENNEASSTNLQWLPLEDIKELDEIEKLSFEKPIAIFKHSTRCSISRFSLKQFEREFGIETDKMDLYFLDLLAHRNISDAIALRFQVQHQSPQLIIIKNGQAIYNASHSDIQADELKQFV